MSIITTANVPAASVAPVAAVNFRSTDAAVQSAAKPLWRVGARAGLLAAVATTVVAAAAKAIDVPIAIDGEAIPLLGFAQLTLFFTAVGVLIAKGLSRWAAKPQRTFVVTTLALTALSVVPDLTWAGMSTATRLTLMTTHLVAAATVIPRVARRLAQHDR